MEDSKQQQTQKILVPVDFSPHSKAALIYAAQIAEALKQSLLVLHVVHDPENMPGYYSSYYADASDKQPIRTIEEIANTMFDEFLSSLKQQQPHLNSLQNAETLVVIGIPVSRIIEVVKSHPISALVMGSQGRTGLRHLLLGSKAEQVVRLCPLPVTIVKHQPGSSTQADQADPTGLVDPTRE